MSISGRRNGVMAPSGEL